jgi:hypothetical protein
MPNLISGSRFPTKVSALCDVADASFVLASLEDLLYLAPINGGQAH